MKNPGMNIISELDETCSHKRTRAFDRWGSVEGVAGIAFERIDVEELCAQHFDADDDDDANDSQSDRQSTRIEPSMRPTIAAITQLR